MPRRKTLINFDQFFQQTDQELNGIFEEKQLLQDETLEECSKRWIPLINRSFRQNKSRYVRRLKDGMLRSTYALSLFKFGTLEKKIQHRRGRIERIYKHTFPIGGDLIPFLPPSWKEKINISPIGETTFLQVLDHDEAQLRQQAQEKRKKSIEAKRKLKEEITEKEQSLKQFELDVVEAKNHLSWKEIQNYYNILNESSQQLNEKRNQYELLISNKHRGISPSGITFLYNYDQQELDFKFDFVQERCNQL